jgi:subtilisin-like proprotein convertase family protein
VNTRLLKLAIPVVILLLAGLALAGLIKSASGKYCGRRLAASPAQRVPARRLDSVHDSDSLHLMIPDGPGGVVTTQLAISGESAVTDVNVRVNITHPWIRDLIISITPPTDTPAVVLLWRFPADEVQNITECWFDDEADTSIYDGTPPFTGYYRPFQALGAFDGIDPNGLWTLRVEDEFEYDTGYVESWGIEFNRVAPLSGTVVNRATRSAISQVKVNLLDSADSTLTGATGRYEFATIAPGTYTAVFSKSGYDTVIVSGIEVTAGGATVVDTSLFSPQFDYASTGDPVNIPDADPDNGASLTVEIHGGVTVADLTVTVNATHPYIGDLSVSLFDPRSVEVQLVAPPTESCPDAGANWTETTFDDSSSRDYATGSGPFTGSWRPAGQLGSFIGVSTRGVWTLRAQDNCSGDVGTLNSFAMHVQVLSAADDPHDPTPHDLALLSNYPNPFNSSTEFSFALNSPRHVSLVVYDINGRLAATLLDSDLRAGDHRVYFAAGSLASGIYFARLHAGEQVSTRKLVLLK